MKILLCDRGSVLAEFAHVLREADPYFDVVMETDVYRGVERAFEVHPDVIVTEIDLQGISGVEIIRRFRSAVPRVKVLVWSNEDSADNALSALGAGAAGYLLKAEGSQRVVEAIRAVLGGLIAVSPRVSDLISQREARGRLRELELEDSLALGARELEQVAQAKAEFLSNVSHELRTPVTVAKGISQVLMRREVPEPERTQFLQKLDGSLDRLMGIVDGMLTIAESERGDLALETRPIDLVPILNSVADGIEERYPHVRVTRALPGTLATTADPMKITEVVRHLLDNACRYSPPSGGAVELRGRSMAEGAVVSVTDRGEGIHRDVVSRAFDEPFSTGEAILRKERAGAGLGLHMARKLVVEHGGVMWVDPLPGGGTRVSFCLPAHSGERLSAPPPIGPEPGEPAAATDRVSGGPAAAPEPLV